MIRSLESNDAVAYGHGAEVTTLCVSQDLRFAASAPLGSAPQIRVWDAATRAVLCVLPPHHRGRVASLAFGDSTRTEALLFSIGDDDDGSLAVWRSLDGVRGCCCCCYYYIPACCCYYYYYYCY